MDLNDNTPPAAEIIGLTKGNKTGIQQIFMCTVGTSLAKYIMHCTFKNNSTVMKDGLY